MLTEEILKFLAFFYGRLLKYLPVLPYYWDDERGTLELCKFWGGGPWHKWRLFCWTLYKLFTAAQALNAVLAFHAGVVAGTDAARIAIDFLFVNAFAIISGFHISGVLRRREIKDFVNNFMTFDRLLKQRIFGGKVPAEARNYYHWIMWMMVGDLAFIPWLFSGVFLYSPNHPRFLFHRIPVNPKPKWLMFLWALIEYLNFMTYGCQLYFGLFVIFTFTLSTRFWLRQLLVQKSESTCSISSQSLVEHENKGENDLGEVITASHRLKIYDTFQILMNMYNNCFSSYLWPSIFFQMIVGQSYGLYGLVKHHSLPIHVFLIFPMCFSFNLSTSIIILTFVGSLNFLSGEFLHGFGFFGFDSKRLEGSSRPNTQQESIQEECQPEECLPAMKKQLKALRPLGTLVANDMFVIKRSALFIVLLIVSNLTINAMLLH